MHLPFSHHLQFQPVDPLGDGSRDDIIREQTDPRNIDFQEDIDGTRLTAFWNSVELDVHGE